MLILAGEEGGRGEHLAHLFLDDTGVVVVHVNGARTFLPDYHRHLAAPGQLVRPQAVEQTLCTLLRPGKVGGKDLAGGMERERYESEWGFGPEDKFRGERQD